MRAEKRDWSKQSSQETVRPADTDQTIIASVTDAISLDAAISPARVLQDQLAAGLTWDAGDEVDGAARWSLRRTLVFLVVSNGLFWLAAVWGVSAWLGSL